MRDKRTGTIFPEWKDHHGELFGRYPLHLRHTLHKSSLFTDKALAGLLDAVQREDYHVNTNVAGTDGIRRRREGQFGSLSGSALLKAVAKGDLWINLRAPQKADNRYGDLLEDIYSEFEARVPGLSTYRHIMTILISSPNVKVPYHADVPGQMLWQIRGRKRLWLYPNSLPFLPQPAIENLIIGRLHETDMTYREWFDGAAQVFEFEPGYMLHWPLNCPHRVENLDCVNVSVTTEHYTRDIRNAYAVNYANGILRSMGLRNLQRQTAGPGLAGKLALAAAVKFSGAAKRAKKPYVIDFEVDPKAPSSVRDISPVSMER